MPRCIWRSRCLTTSTPRRVELSSESDCPAVVCRPGTRSRHPAKWRHNPKCPCSLCLAGPQRLAGLQLLWLIPGRLRSRLILRYVSYGAGSTGAASRRRPCVPPARASKIAAARSLRLIPAGCGSGRGSVPAKHGPQPASMRPLAFRERLSDVEAASTGSFSRASG